MQWAVKTLRLTALVVAGLVLHGLVEAAECPKPGGTLRIGLIGNVDTLDPFLGGSIDRRVQMSMYEPLVTQDAQGNLQPALATSWELRPNNTYRFHLRKGVKFHSGAPFNAEAVRWNLDSQMDPAKPGKGYGYVNGVVKEVRVIDDLTVDFVLTGPYAPFLTFLATNLDVFSHRDPVRAKELGENFTQAPSGTGPFKFKEWKQGSRVVLVRNPDWWGGRVCLDELSFEILPEASTRFAALRAGEIDVTSDLPPEQINQLRQTPGFSVAIVPADRVISLLFNRQVSLWEDLRVRRAISLAIDKKGITTSLLGVLGTPIDSFFGPTMLGYTPVGFLEYDPARAKSLLGEAGFKPGPGGILQKDGKPLKFSLGVGPERDPRNKEIAETIQASLQAIGAQVDLKAVTWSVFYKSLFKPEGMDYDAIILGFASQSADPTLNIENQFNSSKIPPVAQNLSRLRDAKMDQLLNTQASTMDPAVRLKVLQDIQRYMYDQVIAVPIYCRNRDYEMRANVKGFVAHPNEWWSYLYSSVWLDR